MSNAFGFFDEIGGTGGSLIAASRSEAQPDEANILLFLEDGLVLMESPDTIVDPLQPQLVAAPAVVLTDGSWIWPAALMYFVRTYHVAVPDDFVAHMRSRDWSVTEITVDDEDRMLDLAAAELGLRPMNFPEDGIEEVATP